MTPAEKILRRFQENKLVTLGLVVGVVVIGLASFTDAVSKLARITLGTLGPHQDAPQSEPKLEVAHYREFKHLFDGVYGPRKIAYGTSGSGEVFVSIDLERRLLLLRGTAAFSEWGDSDETTATEIEISDQVDLGAIFQIEGEDNQTEYVFPVTYKLHASISDTSNEKKAVPGYNGTFSITARLSIDKNPYAWSERTLTLIPPSGIKVGDHDLSDFGISLYLLNRKLSIHD